jgi:hypothetical protein
MVSTFEIFRYARGRVSACFIVDDSEGRKERDSTAFAAESRFLKDQLASPSESVDGFVFGFAGCVLR